MLMLIKNLDWSDLMNEYNICNCADENIFLKQCKALEKKLGCTLDGEILQDVDGSKIATYTFDNKTLKVYNDYCVGAVYIKADFDLEKYFD